MLSEIRIVWNITRQCPYHCSFCAASAGPNHLKEDAKKKRIILQSILSVGCPVKIDFSGGDPWQGEGSVEIMLEASCLLGKSAIEISGLGISTFDYGNQFLLNLASKYSFTYDQPWWYPDERVGYNLANRLALQRLQHLGITCNVSLVIRPLEEQHWNDLVQELLKMNPALVHLIRLMPLGRNRQICAHSNTLAEKLIDGLRVGGYAGYISKSCTLTGRCDGCGKPKFGLDPDGNLFCCIWAADLPILPAKNPFFLGNLTENSLAEIITVNAQKFEEWSRDYCHVLRYLNPR